MDLVGDGFQSVPPQFLLDSVGQEGVTRLVSHVDDTLLGVGRGLNAGDLGEVDDLVDDLTGLGGELVQSQDVDLVDDEDDGLVVEQGLDRVEELALSLDRVSTLLGNIHKVEDGGSQVSEGGDGLHLDGGELLQRSVQETGSVDHLPSQVSVVHVSDEQGLGGERVLHIPTRY